MASLRGLLFGGILGLSGGLFLGIVIGALLMGGLTYVQTGGTNIPYNTQHSTVANGFIAKDTTKGIIWQLKHVMTTQGKYGGSYDTVESFWYWTEGGNDVQVTLSIWGPLPDGSYQCEFGRSVANGVEIAGFGHTINWPSASDIGYANFQVTLS
jgi:hypothetical protein